VLLDEQVLSTGPGESSRSRAYLETSVSLVSCPALTLPDPELLEGSPQAESQRNLLLVELPPWVTTSVECHDCPMDVQNGSMVGYLFGRGSIAARMLIPISVSADLRPSSEPRSSMSVTNAPSVSAPQPEKDANELRHGAAGNDSNSPGWHEQSNRGLYE
jgi:hypothetical protein